MIKKFIGLLLIFFIFYLAIKALVFLPFFTDLIIGKNRSPFQVGTDYVNQVNDIYPYNKDSFVYNNDTKTNIIGKVTLEKNSGKLIMYIESADPKSDLNIWLVNTPEITNKTEYIDFGKLIKNNSIMQYVIDMKGADISLGEYNTVFLVDVNAGYQAYAKIILK